MLEFLELTAREAGAQLLELQHSNLTRFSKGSFDFATEADLRSQEHILQRLTTEFPGVAILAEEQAEHVIPKGNYFAIDPLDGTISYSGGSKSWGVIISYISQGQPEAGVIYMPAENMLLSTSAGKGAFVNGQAVRLKPALELCTSIAGADIGAWLSASARQKYILPLIEHAISIRSLGSSAASTMDLVTGVTSLYVSACGAKIWDLAAGYLAVTESGGFACDLNGNTHRWETVPMRGIFSAGKEILAELLNLYSTDAQSS